MKVNFKDILDYFNEKVYKNKVYELKFEIKDIGYNTLNKEDTKIFNNMVKFINNPVITYDIQDFKDDKENNYKHIEEFISIHKKFISKDDEIEMLFLDINNLIEYKDKEYLFYNIHNYVRMLQKRYEEEQHKLKVKKEFEDIIKTVNKTYYIENYNNDIKLLEKFYTSFIIEDEMNYKDLKNELEVILQQYKKMGILVSMKDRINIIINFMDKYGSHNNLQRSIDKLKNININRIGFTDPYIKSGIYYEEEIKLFIFNMMCKDEIDVYTNLVNNFDKTIYLEDLPRYLYHNNINNNINNKLWSKLKKMLNQVLS